MPPDKATQTSTLTDKELQEFYDAKWNDYSCLVFEEVEEAPEVQSSRRRRPRRPSAKALAAYRERRRKNGWFLNDPVRLAVRAGIWITD